MKNQLRNDNLVLTPQREAVLQAVRQSQLHLTASEIYESARQRAICSPFNL